MTEQPQDAQQPQLQNLMIPRSVVKEMLDREKSVASDWQLTAQQYALLYGAEQQRADAAEANTATLEAAVEQLTGTIQAQNRRIAELEALITEGPKTGQPEPATVEGDAAPEPVNLDTKRSRKKNTG